MVILVYIFIMIIFSIMTRRLKIHKLVMVILSSSLLILIAALRDINFGSDVYGYALRYSNYIKNIDISILWQELITLQGKDPFFNVFSKVISLAGFEYRGWLTIIASMLILSISFITYKYSNDIFMSHLAFISLGFYMFSLQGLRQAIALAFVLLSYMPLVDRRPLKFSAIVMIGSLFHASAAIFLIAYPFARIKIGKKHIISTILAFITATYFSNLVREIIRIIAFTDTYANYADREVSLTLSGLIIQLFVLVFCIYYKDSLIRSHKDNTILFNLLFLGIIFQSFSTVIAEIFRVSIYFSIFSVLLIPRALDSERIIKKKVLVYYLVTTALIMYIIRTGTFFSYSFYW